MITALNLKNFRGFEELDLSGLQRVNLIVGRNNAGKTSLLESISVLANPQQIGQMARRFRTNPGNAFFRWLVRDGTAIYAGSISAIIDGKSLTMQFSKNGSRAIAPGLVVAASHDGFVLHAPQNQKAMSVNIIAVQPPNPDETVKLFGAAVAKKGGEEQMDALFHEIDSRIRKVRVISAADGFQIRFDFNLSEMIPLSQVGQGVHRLITIFSELIAQRPDICMIDELENGIHHSMLEQVWSGLAIAAENLNLQIFATTHSYECIEAAHAVFSKRQPYDFSIVQLFRTDDGVRGRVLDRKHIEAALSGEIDLR